MSLRIAPPEAHPSSVTNTGTTQSKGAPSAPGLHDTLRSKLSISSSSITSTTNASPNTNSSANHQTPSSAVQSSHPLEARLKNWQAQQDQLKMNLLRRQFGIAEPVRRGMELKICREGEWRPQCLGGSASVGEDILTGRDADVTWEDVYRGDGREGAGEGEMQAELDARVGLGQW